jgi:hypothetical protein
MRALCLITVKAGKVDAVVQILKKKRKIIKDVGTMDEINQMVIDLKKIKDIETTETLIEVEVDLGW